MEACGYNAAPPVARTADFPTGLTERLSMLRQELQSAILVANGLGDPNFLAKAAGIAEGLEQALAIMESTDETTVRA